MNLTQSNLSPRTDATAQLLLLLAREVLSPAQIERARVIAADVADWDEAVRLAYANFSLPFLHRHLPHLVPNGPPSFLAEIVRREVMLSAVQSLRTAAALARFHVSCIAPGKVAHVYLKGPALAATYYREPSLRASRDIDLLVERKYVGEIARSSLMKGSRILLDKSTFAMDDRDIDFVVRHSDVLSIVDSTGIHFEIHRKIEKQTSIFPAADVFSSAEQTVVAGQPIRAMEMNWLFCYIAYHHSRHLWSRLHWVADLHAMMAHPHFEAQRVMELAARLGLSDTVAAAISFAQLTDKPEAWDEHLGRTHGGSFLDACLRGLQGDSAFEAERSQSMFLLEFANSWQVDPGRRLGFWANSAWHRLAPTPSQYIRKRRSRAFEFLYIAENAFAITGNAVTRLRRR